ncbi:MAG: hypothetical protein D8M59_11300 [Planctomycetes bacterium]|nr:hypothetical protein [Planctomycetota bacterium]
MAAEDARSGLLPAVDAALAFEHTPVVIPARLTGDVEDQDLLNLMAPEVRSTLGHPLAASVAWLYIGSGSVPQRPPGDGTVTAWTHVGEAEPVLTEVAIPELEDSLARFPSQIRPFILIPWDTHLAEGALTVNGRVVRIDVQPAPAGDLGAVGDWLDYPGSVGGVSRTPFEAFRRTLMYDQADPAANARMPDSALIQALARQNTQRWLFGLGQFAHMPGLTPNSSLSDDLTHVLTRQCNDGPVRFATWLNQPARMSQLELLLLAGTVLNPADDDADLTATASAIAAMISSEPNIVFWIESDHGQTVQLAAANLSQRIAECEVSWESAVGSPVRSWFLSPGQIERMSLPRPDPDAFGGASATQAQVIRISHPWDTISLGIDPPQLPVRPPGLTIARFVSAWRQPSWLAGRPIVADENRGTSVAIQLGPDGWELIVTATAVLAGSSTPGDRTESSSGLRPTDVQNTGLPVIGLDPAGVESLTLIVGPIEAPIAVTTFEPYAQGGRCIDWLDSGLDVTEVQVRAEAGHWAVRIPIPAEWLNERQVLDIGFVRSHAGLSSVDVFPRPCFPWHLDPGRMRFDLSQWEPMPGAASE